MVPERKERSWNVGKKNIHVFKHLQEVSLTNEVIGGMNTVLYEGSYLKEKKEVF